MHFDFEKTPKKWLSSHPNHSKFCITSSNHFYLFLLVLSKKLSELLAK